MKIDNNTVVSLAYDMFMDGEELVDTLTEEEPFQFIFGVGQIFSAFEDNLKGKNPGDRFLFDLAAKDAYGDYNPENRTEVPISTFEELDEGTLKPGISLPLEIDGNLWFGVVEEINDDQVKMDLNHPLAGHNLRFAGKVVDVRAALKSELDLGKIKE